MNMSQYLVSILHSRSILRSSQFAILQAKLHRSQSIPHAQPPSSTSAPKSMQSKHDLNTSSWYSQLGSSPKWCSQRLFPAAITTATGGVQHLLQEHRRYRRSCRSWTSSSKSETVSGAVAQLIEKFESAAIPESDVCSKYIVAHALGVKQLSDFERMDQSRILSAEERVRVTELANKKLARVPLQYILGEWDFRDLTLKMKPPVFIPRPETEMLVDLVVSHYEEEEELDILEVGCGSGAISLSLLHEFERAHGTAIDANRDAVMLTQENATRLGLGQRLSVHHTILTDRSSLDIHPVRSARYDVIVSNPPYVCAKDMDDLDPEVTRYEDLLAVKGGAEGLDVILLIIKQARLLLKPHGLIWLETDTRHSEMIQEWLVAHPEVSVQFNKSFMDFTDRPRFCQLEYTP